ncbi:MAG: hypothetical protein ABI863_18430 [Ginsengibacter sp.]
MHRSRLFAQHLPSFGWEPIILTVHEKYYEETLDYNLERLLPAGLRVVKVNAFGISKPRIIGDIGLRAFFQLYKKAKQLIQSEKIDFLYITVPSFYCALLGRWLHRSTNIKYGIDYIDPWVHRFPGSDKIFSRHWMSTKIARLLETIAVKKASLITGVAEGYYQAVLERNPHLKTQAVCGAMPYGGEASDHAGIDRLNIIPYLFSKEKGILKLVYAGAMLPKAYVVLEAIFKAITANRNLFEKVEFHFIGSGSRANDAGSYNIKPLAEKYDLYNSIVYEYPKRIPYLDVLVHLDIADGIFILGSTEPHYTPSKTYQGILSGKPIFAVLHKESTAVEVLQESGAGIVLIFDGENDIQTITDTFPKLMTEYVEWKKLFDPEKITKEKFNEYSAGAVTQKLAKLLNKPDSGKTAV